MPTATVPAGTYSVDPVHSNVSFEIKHMGIATVRGTFRSFTGSIEVTDSGLSASGSVEVASVDTGQADRDGHLQSPDFFDSAQFPQITFTATSAQVDGEDISLEGELTIHGETRPITLTGTVEEGGEDPWGNQRVGFDLATTIDRTDFGLSFDQAAPGGNLLVAKKVKLLVAASAVKA